MLLPLKSNLFTITHYFDSEANITVTFTFKDNMITFLLPKIPGFGLQ